jgi:UDP-GlcNAc:undecaprenyl-phosphate/decaprenyl-phosphate GlcNAc-1-phosphate transferase
MLTMAMMGGLMALLLSLALTPLVRSAARRYGYVAQPRVDRWHQQPTALFGGVAIFIAFTVPFVALHAYDRSILFLMAGATVVFGLGIVDDLYRIQPYTKLVAQIGAASLATFGSFIPSSDMSLILIPLAIFGLVALTNAFNLLDNMDGLSAGIACIAAFFLLVISFTMQNWLVASCAAILFGATLGFLFYNFNPATIFMGDSGSMFLGFLLGALTMKGNWEQATNLLLMLLTPLLVLAVPIFDTTFVTLVRWMNGRAISVGGRDHTSHRLVAFGLSERQAVLFFYLISMVCGFIAVLGVRYNAILPALLGTLMVIGISYLGMFLNGVVVYGTEGEVTRKVPEERGVVLDIFVMHKRRILEVLLDMTLMTLAYAASFAVRFDGDIPKDHFAVLARSLPLIITLKLIVFSSFGLYRGVWRYVGMQDLIAILKAVTVSSLLAIAAMTMLFRFELFPRTVFAIDWMILLLLVAGVRVLIRVIREYLLSLSEAKGTPIVIVGAGDAGVMALREFQNNSKLGYTPVAFFDDDPDKHGRMVHGVPVVGGRDKIRESVVKLGAELIVLAIPSAAPEMLGRLVVICESTGLPVTVMPSLADLIGRGFKEGAFPESAWKLQSRTREMRKEQTWN